MKPFTRTEKILIAWIIVNVVTEAAKLCNRFGVL